MKLFGIGDKLNFGSQELICDGFKWVNGEWNVSFSNGMILPLAIVEQKIA
jgi:hypothetical protein